MAFSYNSDDVPLCMKADHLSITIYHRYILRHIRAVASVLLSFWFIGTACAGTDLLTGDERGWLATNQSRIVLGVETGYAPFVFLDDQRQPTGLAHDYIRLVEAKIGASFKEKQFSSLKDIFEQVHAGEVHVVNAVTKTPDRSQFLTFTEPFISVPNVILVRKDRSDQISEKTLSGLTVSLVKSYAVTENLTNKNLGFSPDLVADDLTALLNASFGRSDAAIIDLATASYLISSKGITNLRVAGEAELDIRLAIATPVNEPVLNHILQKGLAAITEAERKNIHDKWISPSAPSIFTDWRLWLAVGIVLASILVVIAVISIWNRTLRRQVLERTADLEKERANLEQRVKERTAELTRAQSVGQIGSWVLDMLGGELKWSDETYRIFGVEIGKPLSLDEFLARVHPEDRGSVSTAWSQSLAGAPYDIEHRILLGNEVRWVRERAQIEFGVDGSPFLGIGTVQDITERKRAEEELRRYKDHLEEEVQTRTTDLILARDAAEAANKAKSVFLTSINHELRTPLNAILGFSSLLRQDTQLRPEQRTNLDIINRSGEHLLTLINDVLEMAKIEAGKTKLHIAPFDCGAMVRDVADMMHIRAHDKGLRLLIDQSSDFPRYIKADEARLRQVLINLVGNAIKFTKQGGVTMRFGIRSHDVEHLLLIEIEDSGIGISAEDQQHLFQPFIQMGALPGDNKGTGLGLAITKQFVQLMSGKISVESTPGKGSLFRVELPFSKVDASELSKLDASGQDEVAGLAPDQPAYRILIVEDQLENQLLLTQLMQRIGLEVKLAEDGKQGVALFQSWHPHLIFMDRRMPLMDGIEATKAIRLLPEGKEVKIVAVTASAFMEQRDEMLVAGMDDFVRKPYRFNEIYDSLSRQLGVAFCYAETQTVQATPVGVLTAAMLAVLPQELRDELKLALESLREDRIHASIDKVAAYDVDLSQRLLQLVGDYNYPTILEALKEIPAETAL